MVELLSYRSRIKRGGMRNYHMTRRQRKLNSVVLIRR